MHTKRVCGIVGILALLWSGSFAAAQESPSGEAPSAPAGESSTTATSGGEEPTSATATSATPTSATPTNATPTNATPTNAAPTNAVPTNAAPTNAAPTNAAPTNAAPTNATPPEPVSQDDLPPGLRTAVDDEEPLFGAEPEVERAPWRVLASVGVGTSIRLVQNLELQQERFAPAYVEVRGGVVLPQRGRVGHELTLAATTNLSGDGTYTSGIDPFGQWTLTPAYAVRVGFPEGPVPDFVLRGRLGVPLVLTPDVTWGLEVDASITYAFLAGLGAYFELGYATYFGAEDRAGDLTVHPLLAFELGVSVDWEVLR